MEKKKGGIRQCRFCKKTDNRKNISTHTLAHFIKKIVEDNTSLPRTPPYNCPKCSFIIKESNGKYTLVRHIALHHKVILEYCTSADLEGNLITKKKKEGDKRTQELRSKSFEEDKDKRSLTPSTNKKSPSLINGIDTR